MSLPCQQEVQIFFCSSTDEKPESEQTYESQCLEALEFIGLQEGTVQFVILKFCYSSPIHKLTSTGTLWTAIIKPYLGEDMAHQEKECAHGGNKDHTGRKVETWWLMCYCVRGEGNEKLPCLLLFQPSNNISSWSRQRKVKWGRKAEMEHPGHLHIRHHPLFPY